MSRVRSVPPEAAEGPLADAYARVREARGEVANVHAALGLRPAAVEALLALQTGILHAPEATPGLSRRERELVGLVASRAAGDPYAFTHHADAFSRYAAEPGLVARVAAGDLARLAPREQALARFAERLAREPAAVEDADVGTLREAGMADEEILDAVLVVAAVAFVNRVALGLGVGREDAPKAFRY